ncbi:MAG: ABC transporter permease, partial [Firmicutes bacterium]|nr:ABC transporter permease [Bacillota bacterium]
MLRKTTLALGEAVRIAVASLWAHKLRSLLTLLGVVIGVSAVIAVVSLINGANSYVAEKVFNLGTDVFLISRGPSVITDIDSFLETQKRKKLTLEDYEAVRQACTLCRDVGATATTLAEVEYGASSVRDSNIRGWTPSMARIYDVELTAGRHLSEADMQRAASLCVIGWDVADNLFPGTDPLGKEIRVGNHVFEVVGVGKKLGSALGQSRDNWVMITLRTFQKIYGTEQ